MPSLRNLEGVCLGAGPVPVNVKSDVLESNLRGDCKIFAMFDFGDSRTEILVMDFENLLVRLLANRGSSSRGREGVEGDACRVRVLGEGLNGARPPAN